MLLQKEKKLFSPPPRQQLTEKMKVKNFWLLKTNFKAFDNVHIDCNGNSFELQALKGTLKSTLQCRVLHGLKCLTPVRGVRYKTIWCLRRLRLLSFIKSRNFCSNETYASKLEPDFWKKKVYSNLFRDRSILFMPSCPNRQGWADG